MARTYAPPVTALEALAITHSRAVGLAVRKRRSGAFTDEEAARYLQTVTMVPVSRAQFRRYFLNKRVLP